MLEDLNQSHLQGERARARLKLELVKMHLALNLFAKGGDV